MGFSGAISDRFNAKLLVTAAVLSYTILSFASPFFARLHYYVFLISRFVMGLVEGFVFPCMTTIGIYEILLSRFRDFEESKHI